MKRREIKSDIEWATPKKIVIHGLDLCEEIVHLHSLPFRLCPADERALFHRGRQLRKSDDLRHLQPSR